MQQYGPQNPNAPAPRPAPSLLEQEARRTGLSVEELQDLIRGSQATPPAPNMFVPRGPQIGADRQAEGMAARGMSPGQIGNAQRSRYDNTMRYGSAQPSMGQMISVNTQRADALHGNQGLLNAPQDALAFAGPYAVFNRVAPVVAASRPLQFVNRVPGVAQTQRVARAIDPSFTRGTTSGTMENITGRLANSTVGAGGLGAIHDQLYGTENKAKRKAASAAKNFGLMQGPMSRILPLLTGGLGG